MITRAASRAGAWRRGRFLRLAGTMLAALLLLSVAVIGGGAQEAGAEIRLSGMVDRITRTIIHQFTVELTNLTATEDYQVLVSSDRAAILGIGGCGTAQTRTVTGATARDLRFIVHACAVGEGTVTAEVRRAGASVAEASVSQRVTVVALPEIVIGPTGERIRTTEVATAQEAQAATAQAAQQVGRPDFVPGISFPEADRKATSVKVTWGETPNGGRALTGFGLLFWRKGDTPPAYSRALVKGAGARSHTYPNLQPSTTYQFRIHACNGPDSCGYWTNPPKEVTTKARAPTVRPPGAVRDLQFSKDHESFTVSWKAPHDDGGRAITGYGILQWRDGRDRPAYSAATTVSGLSKRYGGLQPDTKYWVKVHACNGRDSCGPWTGDTEVTTDPKPPTPTPRPEPTPPGPVTQLRVTSSGKNRVTIAWNAPQQSGSAALTGYHVQHREAGTSWPTGSDVVTPATTTTRTVQGLINGTPYDVQVQACNGDNRCGEWAGLEDVIPGNKVGNARLEVAKTAIKVGERLQVTIYDIPVGKVAYANMYGAIQPEGRCPNRAVAAQEAAQRSGRRSTGGWYDSFRIEGCADGGTGRLRVTNADESELYAYVTIQVDSPTTPTTPPEPTVTQPPGPGTPVAVPLHGICGTRTSGDLHIPTNLDVIPLTQRRAVLTWDSSVPAGKMSESKYDVQVRKFGESDPEKGWAAPPHDAQPTLPCATINLDEIITDSGGTKKGLAHAPYAYQFRVRSVVGDASQRIFTHYSKIITIVDTPITKANGHSPKGFFGLLDTPGKAEVTWNSVNNASDPNNPDAILTSGSFEKIWYQLRYRKATDDTDSNAPDHSLPGWRPEQFESAQLDDDRTSSNSATINGLDRKHIYAIQLLIMQLNDQSSAPADAQIDAFAARDVYVWPSDKPVDDEETVYDAVQDIRVDVHARVAGFPLDYRLTARTSGGDPLLEYQICDETFNVAGAEKPAWLTLIKNAFNRWQAALPTDLVTIRYSADPCTNFQPLIIQMIASINLHIATAPLTGMVVTDSTKRQHVDSFLQNIRTTGMLGTAKYNLDDTIKRDLSRNEVILYDDSDRDLISLRKHAIFSGLSKVAFVDLAIVTRNSEKGIPFPQIFGHEYECWFKIDGSLKDDVAMCARPSKRYNEDLTELTSASTDIFISLAQIRKHNSPIVAPELGAEANSCFLNQPEDPNSVYGNLLHEIGHALGIGFGEGESIKYDEAAGWDVSAGAHPTFYDSVMNYLHEPDCAPYPLDVMAIYALYQSR